jgi:hypothetical protein
MIDRPAAVSVHTRGRDAGGPLRRLRPVLPLLLALVAAPASPASPGAPHAQIDAAPSTVVDSGQWVDSVQTVDHSRFDGLLRRHVAKGMVDYDAFAASPEFRAYLDALAATVPDRLPMPERLAYWINVYNAYTIRLVTEHKERRSIRNINKSLGFLKLKGPWRQPIVKAGGRTYTLTDVEQVILRRQFREPRFHFALACAAMGCPTLRRDAYTGEKLNAQLNDQARTFLLLSPEKNRVDVANRTVYWSMLFDYYRDDFGGSNAAIGRYIAQFYPPGPERELLLSGQFKTEQTVFDWTLNSQENARSAHAPL